MISVFTTINARRVLKTVLPAGLLVTIIAGAAASGGQPVEADVHEPKIIHENDPEWLPDEFATPSIEGADGAVAAMAQPRSLELANAFVRGRNIRDLEPVAAQRIEEGDAYIARHHPGVHRVGIVRSFEDSPVSVTNDDIIVARLADETTVRTLAIHSPGAHGLRLHFAHVDLAEASMIVYGLRGDSVVTRGPFTGAGPERDGDFWTSIIPGDTAYIEITGDAPSRFEVLEIIHFDRNPAGEDAEIAAGGPLPCHLDVMCESSINTVARQATGQMNFTVGGNSAVCSGTLLGDLDPDTFVPYFLTAAHCLNTQSQVNSLEIVWFWQRNSCNGALPDYFTLPRNNGGQLLSTQSDNDHTFIRLIGTLPSGTSFAGWTTETSVDNAQGVHHPAGSFKRAVFLDSVGFCPGCLCQSGSNYDYYNFVRGLTEGGSSGSGVFKSNGQLSGQLRGCCSSSTSCDNRRCDNISSFWAVYGEFEETYPRIRIFLEIGGTIHVNRNFSGIPLGTPGSPFTTVLMAHLAAWGGTTGRSDPRISIRAGTYPETLELTKKVTLIHGGGAGVVQIGQ